MSVSTVCFVISALVWFRPDQRANFVGKDADWQTAVVFYGACGAIAVWATIRELRDKARREKGPDPTQDDPR